MLAGADLAIPPLTSRALGLRLLVLLPGLLRAPQWDHWNLLSQQRSWGGERSRGKIVS